MAKQGALLRDMRPFTALLKNFANYHDIDKDINIFEIGVRRGISTRAWLEGLLDRNKIRTEDQSKLYSVDIEDRSKSIHPIKLAHLHDKWEFIQADSAKLKWDKPIDILFIDGNHSYEYVKSDFEKYEPYVRDGGYIFMHDVTHPRYGVRKFWEEISYPWKFIIDFNLEGMGVIKKYDPKL